MFSPLILGALLTTASLTAATPLARRDLTPNDLILWGANGRVEIVDKATYYATTQNTVGRPAPIVSNTTLPANTTATHQNTKRGCKSRNIIVRNKDEYFLNWDVPMSSVVHSSAGNMASVSVTSGYSISDTLTTSVGTSAGIADYFSVTVGVEYSESWSSSYTAGYTFSVPDGLYGVVVSNPATTRRSGTMQSGCIGDFSEPGVSFTGDSYESKAFGGLSWVDGVIGLCTSSQYPVPMCVGDGVLS